MYFFVTSVQDSFVDNKDWGKESQGDTRAAQRMALHKDAAACEEEIRTKFENEGHGKKKDIFFFLEHERDSCS